MYCILEFLLLCLCQCYGVEVHFETSDSGFFLKNTLHQPIGSELSKSAFTELKPRRYDFLSVDRLTIVETSKPISIRASYGPFSTKQTVPARFIVPDIREHQEEYSSNTTAELLKLSHTNLYLDISAHLVINKIPQDSPILRVLFHAGADSGGQQQRRKMCVLVHVSMGTQTPLKGKCTPEGEDGVCLAEVMIPSFWWPSFSSIPSDKNLETPQKSPQRWAKISYSVFEPVSKNPEKCEPKLQIKPQSVIAQVALVTAFFPFKVMRLDEHISILLPQHPMYAMSKIQVIVLLHSGSNEKLTVFTLRAKVKTGVKILGIISSSEIWNISYQPENQKNTSASVTALRYDKASIDEDGRKESIDKKNSVKEIFSWSLQITNEAKLSFDGGKIAWSVFYGSKNANIVDEMGKKILKAEDLQKKIVSKFEINKDDIQAVIPMAKNWEIMNTAVLTGRQVSQAMKIFIVSQAGKIADVTSQCSCNSEDQSVIKVSSSCSSVYVDGSEIRGSSNASIVVKYGTYSGIGKFIVWMPEFPLEVNILDNRLSQIKSWKVLDRINKLHKERGARRKKRSHTWEHHIKSHEDLFNIEKICRIRYQQSPVDVYARFLATDQNSGRVTYFISRRTGLRITDLVKPLLRVADPKIATFKGTIVQGKSNGRTDVQVLSPITGRVIGAKEVRIAADKVSVVNLSVRVVSGLQLSINTDNSIENGYILETTITHKLTAQYQEGLLDIDLEFSDGFRTPLREIDIDDYFLLVESLDTEVVAFAPMLASNHPRVIAVGEGNGDLLRVALLLSEDCRIGRSVSSVKQLKSSIPLASSLATVQVDFNNNKLQKQEAVQNDDAVGRFQKGFHSNDDLADIIGKQRGINLLNIQTRNIRDKFKDINKRHKINTGYIPIDMTSMEAGLYILLSGFCCAIIIFVVSCVVYASKFKTVEIKNYNNSLPSAKNTLLSFGFYEEKLKREQTTNSEDWIWLGRSELQKTCASNEHVSNDSHKEIKKKSIPHYGNVNAFHNNQQFLTICSTSNARGDSSRPKMIASNATEISKFSFPIYHEPKANNLTKSPFIYKDSSKHINTTNKFMDPSSESWHLYHGHNFSPKNTHANGNIIKEYPETKKENIHKIEQILNRLENKNSDAFQFDYPILNRSPSTSNVEASALKRETRLSHLYSNNKPELFEINQIIRKKATIISNPMCSQIENENYHQIKVSDFEDLNMNTDEAMQYFQNLKESNA